MKKVFSLVITSLLLASCSSSPTVHQLSQGGPTMKELERSKLNKQEDLSQHSRVFKTMSSDINKNQIERFAERRVPNPELILIHLPRRDKNSGVIIPKYSTRYPMYDRVHYSLTREIDRNVK